MGRCQTYLYIESGRRKLLDPLNRYIETIFRRLEINNEGPGLTAEANEVMPDITLEGSRHRGSNTFAPDAVVDTDLEGGDVPDSSVSVGNGGPVV